MSETKKCPICDSELQELLYMGCIFDDCYVCDECGSCFCDESNTAGAVDENGLTPFP